MGVSLVAVACVYLLMLASLDPLDVAAAVVVAAAILGGFRSFVFAEPRRDGPSLLRRVAGFPAFAAAIVRDIVVGTWEVALVVLHLRPLRAPGIVAIPLGERTRTGVAVGAFVATLSPGEFLVDVDEARRVMLLHVIDASDPDEVRRKHDRFYERFQRKVFP
ncbi:MAG TPA: Na+/H+ antiporter subunit E [Gaiellaceae bacterium]|nr:Na+/H+ antiporter subunit E [Gaiellaceae bacterium]